MTKMNSKIEGDTLGILRRSFFPFNALGMPSFNNSVSHFQYFLVYFCLTAKKPTVFTEQETNRIVGGFDTKGLLPYQLKLKTRDEFYIYGCGGILISSKFGITADHCIIGKKYSRDAIIFAGLYIWEDYDNQGVRIFL